MSQVGREAASGAGFARARSRNNSGIERGTVLIVDDNDAMRMVCRVNLEMAGYRVVEAESAEGAAAELETEDVALVLLDRRLIGPEDGLAVASRIRATYPDVAIVGISGTVPIPESFTHVVDASVTKPFGVDELLDTVRRFVPEHTASAAPSDDPRQAGE